VVAVAVGVDLGQKRDPTAIAVVEAQRREQEGRSEDYYITRFLERLPLGTPYPDIAQRVQTVIANNNKRSTSRTATGASSKRTAASAWVRRGSSAACRPSCRPRAFSYPGPPRHGPWLRSCWTMKSTSTRRPTTPTVRSASAAMTTWSRRWAWPCRSRSGSIGSRGRLNSMSMTQVNPRSRRTTGARGAGAQSQAFRRDARCRHWRRQRAEAGRHRDRAPSTSACVPAGTCAPSATRLASTHAHCGRTAASMVGRPACHLTEADAPQRAHARRGNKKTPPVARRRATRACHGSTGREDDGPIAP
jgi:hypothetical protein